MADFADRDPRQEAMSFLIDQEGRPLRWTLKFGEGRTAYTFAGKAEAEAFAREQWPEVPPEVVPYTPPTLEDAIRLVKGQQSSHRYFTTPCRF